MRDRGPLGILLGILAAAAFGAGGVMIKPLLLDGWSPAAAVLGRVGIAAIVLAIPALIALKWDLRPLWRARWTVLLYGGFAVAGVQVAYFAAIERIPVSTTLLIEYLAPVGLVLLAWARGRRRPEWLVLIGAALAVGGLVLVVGPGSGGLDPLGLLFAGLAMTGVAVYYTIGDRSDSDVPPVALAAAGFVVGWILLALVALTGLLPVEMTFGEVAFFGAIAPWWLPLLAVGLLSTAFAYVAGLGSITLLGTRSASFLGLLEVVFAGLLGWIALGESMGPLQIVGGVLIVGGIISIRLARAPQVVSTATASIPVVLPAPEAEEAHEASPDSLPAPIEAPAMAESSDGRAGESPARDARLPAS